MSYVIVMQVIVDNISFCLNYRNSNPYRVIRYGIYKFLKSKVERKVGPLLVKRKKDISSRISVLDSSNVCCRISNNTIDSVMQVYWIFFYFFVFYLFYRPYQIYNMCQIFKHFVTQLGFLYSITFFLNQNFFNLITKLQLLIIYFVVAHRIRFSSKLLKTCF